MHYRLTPRRSKRRVSLWIPSKAASAGKTGTASWTEDDDVLAAAGVSTHVGTGAWTEADDVLAAAGVITHLATSSWTEANDTLAAAGTKTHLGTAAWTEDNDTLLASNVSVLYPASVSGRKLLDQNGNVFLLFTMSSWAMASNLSNSDITTALTGVAANGFTGVTVFIGGGYHLDGTWHAYTNQAGNNFWTGTPWASSLGSAWSSVDWVVSECQRLGLVLSASLAGGNGTTGARPDWNAVTNTDMTNAGVAIATRYPAATYPHVIWHVEFDSADTTATTGGQRIEAFFSGVNSVEGTARPVRWVETDNGTSTNGQGWINTTNFKVPINCMYDYTADSAVNVETVYAEVAGIPVGDCEPRYVGNSITRQDLRERTYAVFLEGGCLLNFGHEDWWPFGSNGLFTDGETWPTVQAATPLVHQRYANALLTRYAKDSTWAPEAGAFVTTGQGSGDTKCAAGSSNTAALAYFPNSRTIVVDTTIIAGTGNVRLRWYDPTNDTYSSIATSEAQNASRSVIHPGNTTNSAGDSDYVLVVDQPPAGTAAWTEDNDIFSAAGQSTHVGTAAWTEANDTLAAAGASTHVGVAAWTEADDIFAASGSSHTQSGTASWTETDDTLVASGASTHTGVASWTEADDVLAAIGQTGNEVGGPAAWTEADDVFSGAGVITHLGTLTWTEADDAMVALAVSTHVGAASWTEVDDIFSASGGGLKTGTIAWTEDDDVLVAVGRSTHVGYASWTEQDDVFAAFTTIADPYPELITWTENTGGVLQGVDRYVITYSEGSL
jgi:hypothetical protein